MKKQAEQSAILHDAYFNKPPCLTRLFLVRLILVCCLSVSAVYAAADLYLADINMLAVCGITALASVLIYVLASVLPSWAVYIGSIFGYGALFLNDALREKLSFFYDWFVLRIHGRLLKTEGFTIHSLERLKSGFYDKEMEEGKFIGFILLGILMAFLFVVFSRTRFRPFYSVLVFVIPAVPAFGAEIAGYHHSMTFFVAFFFALFAVYMAYELDGMLVFNKTHIAGEALRRNEKSYRKRIAFAFFGRKLKSDIPRYFKYSGNAVVALIVTGSIMLSTAVIIPDGTTFDYEEVFSGVQDFGYTIGEKFEKAFGISLGTGKAVDEYFSYSSYGDNSGGIGISKPSQSERPVLDVVLERNDIPVYLRGDIGVEFDGTGWTAVRDVYEEYGSGYWQSEERFYPEASYQIARQKLSSFGYRPDDFLPLQKVSVSYRRKTNVVFSPLAPFDLDYKSNTYYDSYGDTVYRIKGKGSLNTIDTLALTPNMNYSGLGSFLNLASLSDYIWTVPGWNYDEYRVARSDYENYISKAYRKTDSDIVKQLISELYSGGYIGATSLDEVNGICRYFKENFSYSLTVDNGEGEEVLGNFLYNTKEGHCALFATATVLALRELGYNARYVTGYVVSGEGEKTEDGYKYILREKDLHAWVEVYFYQIGWLPFDPTASVSGYYEYINGEESPSSEAITSETTVSEFNTESGFAPEEVESSLSEDANLPPVTVPSAEDTMTAPDGSAVVGEEIITPSEPEKESILPLIITIIAVIVAAAMVIMAVYLFIKKVNDGEKRTFNGFRKKPSDRAVAEMYKFCMFILEKEGLTPGCEMMPDFAQRVDASIFLKGSNVFMMDVIEVFSKTEFGNPEISPVTEEERGAVYKFTLVVYRKYMENRNGLGRFISKITLFL